MKGKRKRDASSDSDPLDEPDENDPKHGFEFVKETESEF